MHYELKTIELWSLVKISFFFNLVVGFIVGLLYALLFGFIITIMGNLPFARSEFSDVDIPMGAMVIILPFMFAVGAAIFHTLFLVVFGFIYNLIAKLVGGLEFEFNPVAQATQPASHLPSYGYGYPASPPPPPQPSQVIPPAPPSTPPAEPPHDHPADDEHDRKE